MQQHFKHNHHKKNLQQTKAKIGKPLWTWYTAAKLTHGYILDFSNPSMTQQ